MKLARIGVLALTALGFAVCGMVVAVSIYDLFIRPNASDVFYLVFNSALATGFAWYFWYELRGGAE